MNRREFLSTSVGASLAASSLFLRSPAVAGTEDTSLRIGYLPITDAAPLLVAHARGYFADEGLTVAQPLQVRSWSTLAESFLTGKFDLTHMLLPMPVWMRYKNRMPVKMLAWDHTNGSAITVHRDSGIREFSDFRNRRIAVPYWYSMHNIILQTGLRRAGLTPVIRNPASPVAGRVDLMILPPAEMPAALAGRKIDAYIVAEPFNAIAEMRTDARIMRFTGDIWKNHPCCVVVMKEARGPRQEARCQKAVNAVVRAQLWMVNNREKAAELLSREGRGYLPVPKDILLRAFTGYDINVYGGNAVPRAIRHPQWNMRRIDFQPYPYPSATRFIVNAMKQTLMEGDATFLQSLDPDFAARDLTDLRYVTKAVLQAGGLAKFGQADPRNPWEREEIVSP
ncbi:MAG: ABC transporter substrate-binding protein [Thermodesulfobacteriota bacterium]